MKAKVVQDASVVTYGVVCDPGDETVAALTQFARAEGLEASQVTAVGAFERATVGWFDRAAKEYRRIPVDEQCEVLSLIGDIAQGTDGPSLHVHVVLGLADGTTRGGHLLEGRVFPTLEVVVTETPAELRKMARPELGIALIELDQSDPVRSQPVAAAEVAEHAEGTVRTSLLPSSGHTPPGARASLVDAVMETPEVQASSRLEATVPLGDAESLERLRERTDDAVTRPAGSTALVDADLPDGGDAKTGQEPGGEAPSS
jgi:predicted DNA-binding protein with PD1-like motif